MTKEEFIGEMVKSGRERENAEENWDFFNEKIVPTLKPGEEEREKGLRLFLRALSGISTNGGD